MAARVRACRWPLSAAELRAMAPAPRTAPAREWLPDEPLPDEPAPEEPVPEEPVSEEPVPEEPLPDVPPAADPPLLELVGDVALPDSPTRAALFAGRPGLSRWSQTTSTGSTTTRRNRPGPAQGRTPRRGDRGRRGRDHVCRTLRGAARRRDDRGRAELGFERALGGRARVQIRVDRRGRQRCRGSPEAG